MRRQSELLANSAGLSLQREAVNLMDVLGYQGSIRMLCEHSMVRWHLRQGIGEKKSGKMMLFERVSYNSGDYMPGTLIEPSQYAYDVKNNEPKPAHVKANERRAMRRRLYFTSAYDKIKKHD